MSRDKPVNSSERKYLEHYCTSAGLERISGYPFFVAFAFFRFAAIAQGIMFRFLAGNASAPYAREVGMLYPFRSMLWPDFTRAVLLIRGFNPPERRLA